MAKMIKAKEAIQAACDIMWQELEGVDDYESTDGVQELISDVFQIAENLPDELEVKAPKIKYPTMDEFGR